MYDMTLQDVAVLPKIVKCVSLNGVKCRTYFDGKDALQFAH